MVVHTHDFVKDYNCGAHVCYDCGHHAPWNREGEVTQNLARCYCGWSESGGNGYDELLAMGECIDDDVWDDAPYDF